MKKVVSYSELTRDEVIKVLFTNSMNERKVIHENGNEVDIPARANLCYDGDNFMNILQKMDNNLYASNAVNCVWLTAVKEIQILQ